MAKLAGGINSHFQARPSLMMNPSQKSEIMAPLLSVLGTLKISEEALAGIIAQTELISVKSHTSLLKPGEICTHVYFVLSGGFVCRYFNEELESFK
ncbi:MAG: hypothetical protein AAFN10_26260, partial [Bacteroidota bacterium]